MERLTKGSVKSFMLGKEVEDPILQILKVKVVENVNDTMVGIRMKLSDGCDWSSKFVCFVDKDEHMLISRFMPSVVIHVLSFSDCKFQNMGFIKIDSLDILSPRNLYCNIIGNPKRLNLNDTKIVHNGFIPVADLHSYLSKSITIRARLLYQSIKLEYCNSSKYYYIYYLADETKEIRLFHYNNAKIRDIKGKLLKSCNMYIIKNFNIQTVYDTNNTVYNQFELESIKEIEFEKIEDDPNVPQSIFYFTKLSDIKDKVTNGTVIDVIGFCHGVQDVEVFPKKTGGEIAKRVISIVDENDLSVQVDLWESWAYEIGSCPYNQKVLAIRGARVLENDDGKRLTVSKAGYICVEPSISRTDELKSWYLDKGKSIRFKSISSCFEKNIHENIINDMNSEESNDMDCYMAEDLFNEFNTDWDGNTK